jgi:hypothetical protein
LICEYINSILSILSKVYTKNSIVRTGLKKCEKVFLIHHIFFVFKIMRLEFKI